MNLNGVEYWYIRNAQGDIIGLHDKDGVQVVSYVYDSWGKLVSINGTMKDSVGVKNPYRYRGYRYDTETELYYLQSRYYNSEWGRFINADGIVGVPGEVLTTNMFTYSLNNPVNMYDSDGRFAITLAFIAVKAIFVIAAALTTVYAYHTVVKPLVSSVSNKINYVESTADGKKQTASPQQKQTKPSTRGRSKNKLVPDTNAQGDHTTFKQDSKTGEITNYETWTVNEKNPTGVDSQKRYDGIGEPHFNKVTKERLLPHVHDKTVPGDVRAPIPWEIPLKR